MDDAWFDDAWLGDAWLDDVWSADVWLDGVWLDDAWLDDGCGAPSRPHGQRALPKNPDVLVERGVIRTNVDEEGACWAGDAWSDGDEAGSALAARVPLRRHWQKALSKHPVVPAEVADEWAGVV